MKMLGISDCIDWREIEQFVLTTQDPVTGGKHGNIVYKYVYEFFLRILVLIL